MKTWARKLSTEDLQQEILELARKTKFPGYGAGLAGKLHKVALAEFRRRDELAREREEIARKMFAELPLGTLIQREGYTIIIDDPLARRESEGER